MAQGEEDGEAPTWRRLGIIAGGGDLPLHIAKACQDAGQDPFVIGLRGWADEAALAAYDHDWAGVGEIGRVIKALKAHNCDALTFAGIVKRPNFSTLKLDWKGAQLVPKAIAAAARGDDALLRMVIETFEAEGFAVVGAHDAARQLRAPLGPLGALAPNEAHMRDIALAFRVARALGAHDVGQGCVVCDGLVLALEAQEGTDAMLARVPALPDTVRGSPDARRGVLVKLVKPGQERRIDLPTIGQSTVEGASRAGLAGIVVEAGAALVLERGAIAAAADAAGLFVIGLDVDAMLVDSPADDEVAT